VELIAKSLKFVELPIRWIHFGDGPNKQSLDEIVKDLPDNVEVVLRGYCPNNKVLESYTLFNPSCFINVSTTEGVPVSIMEAMSFGVPVIATDVGGTSEIVSNENGKLLPSELSAVELSEAIKEMMSLDEQAHSLLMQGAYKKWESDYDSNKNFSEFARVLNGLHDR